LASVVQRAGDEIEEAQVVLAHGRSDSTDHRQRFSCRRRGLASTSLRTQHKRKVGVAEWQRAIECYGATKARFRIAQRAAAHEHPAELVMRCSNIGLRRDRKAQLLFGLFNLTKPGQHLAEMIMRSRMAGREVERPPEQLACFLAALAQVQHTPKRHQGADGSGLQRQRLAQALFSRLILLELGLAQCQVVPELCVPREISRRALEMRQRFGEPPLRCQRETEKLTQNRRAGKGFQNRLGAPLHLSKASKTM